MSDADGRSREVLERARFLKRTTDLSDDEALTLAWREVGCSHTGIAKRIDSTVATVAGRLERVAAQYGFAAIETKPPDERGKVEVSGVAKADIEALHPQIRADWLEIATAHRDVAPGWIDYLEGMDEGGACE